MRAGQLEGRALHCKYVLEHAGPVELGSEIAQRTQVTLGAQIDIEALTGIEQILRAELSSTP